MLEESGCKKDIGTISLQQPPLPGMSLTCSVGERGGARGEGEGARGESGGGGEVGRLEVTYTLDSFLEGG